MFKLLVLHQLANAIQATGFFLPSIYLPTYTQTLFHASASLSSLTLILINISTMISSIIMGFLVDKLNVMTCIFISAVGTTASVLLVWGLSENLSVIYVFCVLYGIFAGCWTSTWPGIMREISQRSEDAGFGYIDPMIVYGHLCIGRGIGNIISGPLSDAIIRSQPWQGQTIGGYGSGYGVLIIYVGLTSLISGMNFVWRLLGLL
jgi:MFS family permease